MDPTAIASLGIGPVLGVIGRLMAQGDYDKAQALRQQIVDQYKGLNVPSVEDIAKLKETMPDIVGYQEDPQLRQAQVDALQKYRNIEQAGGQDAQFRAGMYDALNQSNDNERANQAANLSAMAQRGMQNSSMALTNSMLGSQNAANQSARAALQLASEGQKRKDAALAALANLGGQMRNQDFGQANTKSQAHSAMQQFNANLMSNAYQNNFQNNLAKTNGVASATNNVAGGYQQQGDMTAKMFSGIGQAASYIPGSFKGPGYGPGVTSDGSSVTGYDGNAQYNPPGNYVTSDPNNRTNDGEWNGYGYGYQDGYDPRRKY